MVVKNPIGLIGDVLGSFPVLQQLNKDNKSFSVIAHEEVKWLYDLVPEIPLCTCPKWQKELEMDKAFQLACTHNLYMSQAYYPFMGYPIPEAPVKANLTVCEREVPIYDYVIAPYGRSAPQDQRWDYSKWTELIKSMPDKTFLVLGNTKQNKYWIKAENLSYGYDLDAHTLCNVLLKARYGCISIVTGISHLCFHLGVKNYLLTNQGEEGWGINSDAVKITDHIPTLEVKTVLNILKIGEQLKDQIDAV